MNYFALNAMIGTSCYANSYADFPEVKDLIAHLDYLGIDRSFVYSANARDWSPVNGNKELLKLIAPYKDRLFPAFVITPACFFEEGTLAWLIAQAKAGNHTYRITPVQSRFPVRHYERILAALAKYRPVVMMDNQWGAPAGDFRDIEELALKYPSISFIITQQMWGGFTNVIDLMWRCRNVYLDTSWIHMRNNLELVRDNFGIERLVFGVGFKSHYGAAVGALAQSDFTAKEKELVAHGNIEKLTGIRPLKKKLAKEPDFKDKLLWKTFKEGKPLKGVTVYDVHSHQDGPDTRGWFIRQCNPETTLDGMVENLDRYGIEKLVCIGSRALFCDNVSGNAEFERQAAKHKGRVLGYFAYNPVYEKTMSEKVFDKFFSQDFFVGFKLLPAYWGITMDSPRYNPVWKYAEKHHLPILIHTWGDAIALKDIAPKYPHAKFILGHSGGSDYGRLQSEEIAAASKNVYFEFCGTFCSHLLWADSIRKFGNRRFVFGSDTGAHNESFELSGLLSIPLPDRELIPVLGENFKRILADRK